jgi:hypothetical protein
LLSTPSLSLTLQNIHIHLFIPYILLVNDAIESKNVRINKHIKSSYSHISYIK